MRQEFASTLSQAESPFRLVTQSISLNQALIPDNYALQRYISNITLEDSQSSIDNYSFMLAF